MELPPPTPSSPAQNTEVLEEEKTPLSLEVLAQEEVTNIDEFKVTTEKEEEEILEKVPVTEGESKVEVDSETHVGRIIPKTPAVPIPIEMKLSHSPLTAITLPTDMLRTPKKSPPDTLNYRQLKLLPPEVAVVGGSVNDPIWRSRLSAGTILDIISNVGILLELQDGRRGLVSIAELHDKVDSQTKEFKKYEVGQKVNVCILQVHDTKDLHGSSVVCSMKDSHMVHIEEFPLMDVDKLPPRAGQMPFDANVGAIKIEEDLKSFTTPLVTHSVAAKDITPKLLEFDPEPASKDNESPTIIDVDLFEGNDIVGEAPIEDELGARKKSLLDEEFNAAQRQRLAALQNLKAILESTPNWNKIANLKLVNRDLQALLDEGGAQTPQLMKELLEQSASFNSVAELVDALKALRKRKEAGNLSATPLYYSLPFDGKTVSGKVLEVDDYGIIIELPNNIRARAEIQDINDLPPENALLGYGPGMEVHVVVSETFESPQIGGTTLRANLRPPKVNEDPTLETGKMMICMVDRVVKGMGLIVELPGGERGRISLSPSEESQFYPGQQVVAEVINIKYDQRDNTSAALILKSKLLGAITPRKSPMIQSFSPEKTFVPVQSLPPPIDYLGLENPFFRPFQCRVTGYDRHKVLSVELPNGDHGIVDFKHELDPRGDSTGFIIGEYVTCYVLPFPENEIDSDNPLLLTLIPPQPPPPQPPPPRPPSHPPPEPPRFKVKPKLTIHDPPELRENPINYGFKAGDIVQVRIVDILPDDGLIVQLPGPIKAYGKVHKNDMSDYLTPEEARPLFRVGDDALAFVLNLGEEDIDGTVADLSLRMSNILPAAEENPKKYADVLSGYLPFHAAQLGRKPMKKQRRPTKRPSLTIHFHPQPEVVVKQKTPQSQSHKRIRTETVIDYEYEDTDEERRSSFKKIQKEESKKRSSIKKQATEREIKQELKQALTEIQQEVINRPRFTLELQISARELVSISLSRLSHAVVVLMEDLGSTPDDREEKWNYVGRTERASRNDNPQWRMSIILPYRGPNDSHGLKFAVYDVPDDLDLTSDYNPEIFSCPFLGEVRIKAQDLANFSLNSTAAPSPSTLRRGLVVERRQRTRAKTKGLKPSLVIRCEPHDRRYHNQKELERAIRQKFAEICSKYVSALGTDVIQDFDISQWLRFKL